MKPSQSPFVYRSHENQRSQSLPVQPKHKRHWLWLVLVLIIVAAGALHVWHRHPTTASIGNHQNSVTSTKPASTNHNQAVAPPNACAANALAKNIIVRISQQHMWACSGSTAVYDNAVVTGMELYPADLTPPGTYHIYAKQVDTTLAGSDSTGSWSDPVSYWMPFLDNQYGVYGFHDATWRPVSDFGHVNINAPYTAVTHGSHGCVEQPLTAAKWLYDWAPIGTMVTIES